MMRRLAAGLGGFAAVVPILAGSAGPTSGHQAAETSGHGTEARNMALVGPQDLQARSAYQPVVQRQDGRWIAYMGHHGGTQTAPTPLNPFTGVEEFTS